MFTKKGNSVTGAGMTKPWQVRETGRQRVPVYQLQAEAQDSGELQRKAEAKKAACMQPVRARLRTADDLPKAA